MELIIQMKTGFFEKTSYHLEAGETGLILTPVQPKDAARILLKQEEIRAVMLIQQKYPELEIQAQDAVYIGIFEEDLDFEETVNYLKAHLNTKIICEYHGGE